MRVIGEIPNKDFKITVFQWNEKYILKFEQGALEQSYKINELDLTSEDELKEIVNDDFLEAVKNNFMQMHLALRKSMSSIL